MATRRLLSRLVRLRALEEELSRLRLEAAANDFRRVEQAMDLAVEAYAEGRKNLMTGVERIDALERTGATVAIELARDRQARIQPRIEAADREVVQRRQEFVEKRTARLQVETLADQAETEAQAEIGRRAQQMLDDWYGRKKRVPPGKTAPNSASNTGQAGR